MWAGGWMGVGREGEHGVMWACPRARQLHSAHAHLTASESQYTSSSSAKSSSSSASSSYSSASDGGRSFGSEHCRRGGSDRPAGTVRGEACSLAGRCSGERWGLQSGIALRALQGSTAAAATAHSYAVGRQLLQQALANHHAVLGGRQRQGAASGCRRWPRQRHKVGDLWGRVWAEVGDWVNSRPARRPGNDRASSLPAPQLLRKPCTAHSRRCSAALAGAGRHSVSCGCTTTPADVPGRCRPE